MLFSSIACNLLPSNGRRESIKPDFSPLTMVVISTDS